MSEEWKHTGWVSTLGKLAWIFIMINGIVGIIWGIVNIGQVVAANSLLPPSSQIPVPFRYIWYLIWSIVVIIIAVIIIRPKFSKPCGEKDWETLYGWYLKLGSLKVPWMFIWGLIFTFFSWYAWGGVFILIPAIMLIWIGPRKYDWK
ncbi:MAG: hypothetical protein ACFFEN_09820 [Candidatus Thorarchaeota archaeon]